MNTTTIRSVVFHNITNITKSHDDKLNTLVCSIIISFIICYVCVFCYQIAHNGSDDHYIINNYSPNKAKINRLINSGVILTININDENEIEYTQDDCCICLSEMIIDDTIHILPCKHYFHDNCIKPWLFEKLTCPLCKFDLINDIEETNESLETNENQIIRIEVI